LAVLQKSANQNRRSVSEEIEARIEDSLRADTHALTEHALTEMIAGYSKVANVLMGENQAQLEALRAEAAAMIRQELADALARLGEAAALKERDALIADLRRERDALIGLVETTLALTRTDKGEQK
jgi:hypothetical protein